LINRRFPRHFRHASPTTPSPSSARLPGSAIANCPISVKANGWFVPCGITWINDEPKPEPPANRPEPAVMR
jgi:hypothetical protein